MKISVAQTNSVKGDIDANIKKHLDLIKLAVSYRSDAIFFSELSLTGYEPELAEVLASSKEDARLDVFQEMSNSHALTIGLGLPTKSSTGVMAQGRLYSISVTKRWHQQFVTKVCYPTISTRLAA
jgi:predicted amidohydrolase